LLDLPGVGENYQDHIRTSNTYRLKDNFTSFDPLIYESGGEFATKQLQLWLDGKYSWYDYTTIAYSFLNWGQVTSNNSESDLIRLAEKSVGKDSNVVDKKKLEFLRNSSVPQIEVIMESNYVGAVGYPGGKFMTLISTVMHPMSRGSVHINHTDPLGTPIIDPKYLSNEYDLQAVIKGAKYSRKIAQTEPMASIWEAEFEPGQGVQTDEQWREFALKAIFSFYHPVGTCAMLPKKDGGVVDSSLVVHGTSNLRVVDCSIMPVLISAHIQTSAYGIAEVAAEMIIRDAKR
jgi:choline dehydrogenase-like flavoprotein